VILECKIKSIIKDIVPFNDRPEDISNDKALEQIGINSILLIKLIVSIENLFNIEFSIENLVTSKKLTIQDIIDATNELINK